MQYLSNGSVLVLKGAERKVMVCGRMQQTAEGKKYDYCACPWPEGFQGGEMILFNNEDIDQVYYIGFQDADELKYLAFVNDVGLGVSDE